MHCHQPKRDLLCLAVCRRRLYGCKWRGSGRLCRNTPVSGQVTFRLSDESDLSLKRGQLGGAGPSLEIPPSMWCVEAMFVEKSLASSCVRVFSGGWFSAGLVFRRTAVQTGRCAQYGTSALRDRVDFGGSDVKDCSESRIYFCGI